MVDLNQIIYGLCYGRPPVIQRSDGLYEFVMDIMPTDQSGTNLWGYFYPSGDSVTLLGSWSTDSYQYDSNTGRWHRQGFM